MKRLFALLVCLVLTLAAPAALPETPSAPEGLKQAEIEQFNHNLLLAAISEQLPPFAAEGGYVVRGANYEILLQGEDLSPDSVVLSAAITAPGSRPEDEEGERVETALPAPAALTGPRGSLPGMKAADLLALFPNENEFLQGQANSAVLYIEGALPMAVSAGFVLRDRQELQLIEYDVYYQVGEGVARTGLIYTVENGFVTAIRSYVSSEALSQQDAGKELDRLRELREQAEYTAFGERGSGRLEREDLTLGGLDFVDTDDQAAIALLGEPVSREALENSDGSTLLILQWDGYEAVFTKKGDVTRAERLTVNGGSFEGPRGLRLNDTLAQVISRFEHSGGGLDGSGPLYGDAENQAPPFGLLVPGEESSLLYYAVNLDGEKVALIAEFVDDLMVGMSITYL